jgi:DNA-binding GntR family transcriptional regulator
MSETRFDQRAEEVRRRIRWDILAGRRAPGSRLRYPDLCESYGASIGVVRKALVALSGQGLVRSGRQEGHIVTPLSQDDLSELVAARLMVEPSVLRSAIALGDVRWEARVIASHHALARTPKFGDEDPTRATDEWSARHTAFHDALFSGCRNPRMMSMTRSLAAEACLYWRWAVPLESAGEVADQHEALLEAAMARDADLAAERLSKHITDAALLLFNHAARRPGIGND